MRIKYKFVLLMIAFIVAVSHYTALGVELEIFYWGDFHAQNTPSKLVVDRVTQKGGGAAALSGLLKSMRQKDMRTLTFDAGDQ